MMKDNDEDSTDGFGADMVSNERFVVVGGGHERDRWLVRSALAVLIDALNVECIRVTATWLI